MQTTTNLLLLAFGVAAAWLIIRAFGSGTHSPAASADPVGTIQGPGTFSMEVVGESHYQSALESICGGRTEDSAEKYVQAVLVLEDHNAPDDYRSEEHTSELSS